MFKLGNSKPQTIFNSVFDLDLYLIIGNFGGDADLAPLGAVGHKHKHTKIVTHRPNRPRD